jgi:hypothetical protein
LKVLSYENFLFAVRISLRIGRRSHRDTFAIRISSGNNNPVGFRIIRTKGGG